MNSVFRAKEIVSPEMIHAVSNILLGLQETPQGKDVLISKFKAANDTTYDPIKTFYYLHSNCPPVK